MSIQSLPCDPPRSRVQWRPDEPPTRDESSATRSGPYVAYLAAPLHMYKAAAYDAALSYLRHEYPTPPHTVLSARELWRSTGEWRRTYREILRPVTIVYIVPDHGTVGFGVYGEWSYLSDRPVYAFGPDGSPVRVSSLCVSRPYDPRSYALVLDEQGRMVL